MVMTRRENFNNNASLKGHEWIPIHIYINEAYWREMGKEVEKICLNHPVLFPNFKKIKGDNEFNNRKNKVDKWGCEWQYELDGIEGIVVNHPLEKWSNLKDWSPPKSPKYNEKELEKQIKKTKELGELSYFATEHGFLFMRLYYLRGYNNFMMDVAKEERRLDELIKVVVNYWEQVFKPFIENEVDLIKVADDLGTQEASMLGPKHFRRWLKPAYQKLFIPARKKGIHVAMHHDGYIMDIMDDIIESGVSIVNPQDLVNGIDNIAKEVKGRVCINIDVDRQKIIPYGSPTDIRELIKEEVFKLGSPAGGLEITCGIYPPTPLKNIEALFCALEDYRTYWVGK